MPFDITSVRNFYVNLFLNILKFFVKLEMLDSKMEDNYINF